MRRATPLNHAARHPWARPEFHRSAEFSRDGLHRFTLLRDWTRTIGERAGPSPYLAVVGLNPSTADAFTDDPTNRRLIMFAEAFGYQRLIMLNAFTLVATDPRELYRAKSRGEPLNDPRADGCMMHAFMAAGAVVVAWGMHCARVSVERRDAVLRMAFAARHDRVMCFGFTKSGAPRHPLYLPAETPLVPYAERIHRDRSANIEWLILQPSREP